MFIFQLHFSYVFKLEVWKWFSDITNLKTATFDQEASHLIFVYNIKKSPHWCSIRLNGNNHREAYIVTRSREISALTKDVRVKWMSHSRIRYDWAYFSEPFTQKVTAHYHNPSTRSDERQNTLETSASSSLYCGNLTHINLFDNKFSSSLAYCWVTIFVE